MEIMPENCWGIVPESSETDKESQQKKPEKPLKRSFDHVAKARELRHITDQINNYSQKDFQAIRHSSATFAALMRVNAQLLPPSELGLKRQDVYLLVQLAGITEPKTITSLQPSHHTQRLQFGWYRLKRLAYLGMATEHAPKHGRIYTRFTITPKGLEYLKALDKELRTIANG